MYKIQSCIYCLNIGLTQFDLIIGQVSIGLGLDLKELLRPKVRVGFGPIELGSTGTLYNPASSKAWVCSLGACICIEYAWIHARKLLFVVKIWVRLGLPKFPLKPFFLSSL